MEIINFSKFLWKFFRNIYGKFFKILWKIFQNCAKAHTIMAFARFQIMACARA
jgi:hypothetical protein